MKKWVMAFVFLAPYAAMAEAYNDYPICKCDTNTSRDNYMGVRLYKNQHTSYSIKQSDGLSYTYLTDNMTFSTTVGNTLTDFLRLEYETGYTGAEFNRYNTNSEYDIWFNMLNVYAFHQFSNVVAPYVGAGIGLTGIWGEINGELDNAFNLTYQVMTGVLFRLNSRIDLDVGAKYVDYGRVHHDNARTKIDATQVYIGATYRFGM